MNENAEALARMAAIWDAAPTTFPVPMDNDQYAEPTDSGREYTDGELDRIETAHEHRMGF